MAKVGIYLNFQGDAEAAFALYRSAFGGEFAAFQRMREVPADPAIRLVRRSRNSSRTSTCRSSAE